MDEYGSITWWGFTPALDLLDEDLTLAVSKLRLHTANEKEPLNVLLVGAGDCRHVIKTIAQCHRHNNNRKIHFYVVESSMELYARHMLLLGLFLEPQKRMGLQEKTELFLELYGNSLVRDQSMFYVEKMADIFIKLVTDSDYLEKTFPILDLSLLKFKERDFLEAILKFWRNRDRTLFDVERCWDQRLRKHLGVRYDAIPNVFDWDYSMKLVEKGASIVHYKHYQEWRHKGVAFEIREGTYDVPNRTLASGLLLKQAGERVARRGYWGDILVSPYITFGIQCERQEFFTKANNQHTSTSQDISEYNILSLCHELVHHKRYILPDTATTTAQSATLTEITEEEEEESPDPEPSPDPDTTNPLDLPYEPIEVDNVSIHFLSLNSAPDLHKKAKYHKLFDLVYLSNSMVHLLNEQLTETFSDTSQVVIETTKFMLSLSDEQHQKYLEKIISIARSVGCKESDDPDVTNSYAEFVYQRKTDS